MSGSSTTVEEREDASRIWSSEDGPPCSHGIHTALYESNTKKHPGKRFYRCSFWKVKGKDCGYFQWLEDVHEHSIVAMQRHIEELKSVGAVLKTRCEFLEIQVLENSNLMQKEQLKRKMMKKEMKTVMNDIVKMEKEKKIMAEKMQKLENRMKVVSFIFCVVLVATVIGRVVGGDRINGTLMLP